MSRVETWGSNQIAQPNNTPVNSKELPSCQQRNLLLAIWSSMRTSVRARHVEVVLTWSHHWFSSWEMTTDRRFSKILRPFIRDMFFNGSWASLDITPATVYGIRNYIPVMTLRKPRFESAVVRSRHFQSREKRHFQKRLGRSLGFAIDFTAAARLPLTKIVYCSSSLTFIDVFVPSEKRSWSSIIKANRFWKSERQGINSNENIGNTPLKSNYSTTQNQTIGVCTHAHDAIQAPPFQFFRQ